MMNFKRHWRWGLALCGALVLIPMALWLVFDGEGEADNAVAALEWKVLLMGIDPEKSYYDELARIDQELLEDVDSVYGWHKSHLWALYVAQYYDQENIIDTYGLRQNLLEGRQNINNDLLLDMDALEASRQTLNQELERLGRAPLRSLSIEAP